MLPYKQNIFGYNIGGPVFIPQLYNTGKQKTFFFWSQQGVILHQVPTNLTGVTPTANQRAGIFNSPIKDPNTGALVPQNSAGPVCHSVGRDQSELHRFPQCALSAA